MDVVIYLLIRNFQLKRLRFQQISKIEKYLLDAFSQCDQYGTAKGILQLLKDIDVNDLAGLFVTLTERLIKDHDKKKVLILFVAAVDVFDIFQKINASDQRHIYTFYKNHFLSSTDAELKGKLSLTLIRRCNSRLQFSALYVALSVHLLAAFYSRPNTAMTAVEIEQEADLYRLHLIQAMTYERSFDNMIVSFATFTGTKNFQFLYFQLLTAFCVLHSSFSRSFPPFEVVDSTLHRLIWTIFDVSYSMCIAAGRQ